MVPLVWGGGEGVLGEGSPPLVFNYSKEALEAGGGGASEGGWGHRAFAPASRCGPKSQAPLQANIRREEGPPPLVFNYSKEALGTSMILTSCQTPSVHSLQCSTVTNGVALPLSRRKPDQHRVLP